jgi:hypothetical protein
VANVKPLPTVGLTRSPETVKFAPLTVTGTLLVVAKALSKPKTAIFSVAKEPSVMGDPKDGIAPRNDGNILTRIVFS